MSYWQRVKSIFEAVVELPASARPAALHDACGDDSAVRESVNELLAAHEKAGAFLESPTMHGIACEAALSGLAHQQPAISRIGAYTLLEVIGEGGFGTVYRARQEEPVRRTVAVKVIKPGMDSREVIARFEGERQALAMMNHPNIAAVLDGGATDQGRPYFVMEYVPGEPITTYCSRLGLDLRARLELFVQVCQAVQHAHQKGIIHRDLKPSNILVSHDGATEPRSHEATEGGREATQRRSDAATKCGEAALSSLRGSVAPSLRGFPKIIDFGVAKATNQRLTDHSIFTQQGALIGTPAYMSPEQADMSQLDIDTRTDVYALGVLLYELLTGTPPFDPKVLQSKGQSEVQRIIREVEPPRPSTRLSMLASEAPAAIRQNAKTPKSQNGKSDAASTPIPKSPVRRTRLWRDHQIAQSPLVSAKWQADAKFLLKRIRGDLDWIVMKCLEKDRARRYETANELALEIQRYLSHQPVLAGPPTLTYRLKKFARRNRAAFAAIAGIAAALLIGLGLSTAGFIAAVKARDNAQEHGRRAEQSAVNAQRAARKADAVNKFLQEMLAAADPKHSAQRDITVREALDRAVEKLDAGSVKGQPDVEAAVRLTIGRTYAELAQFDEAIRQADAATDAYRLLSGQDSLDYAHALQQRGEVLQLMTGRWKESERDFRAALSLSRAGGASSALIASCANSLACSLISQQRYPEAETLLLEAIQLSRLPENSDHPLLAEALNNRGLVHLLQQKWEIAESLLLEALKEGRHRLGTVHPHNATTLDNLGQALQGKGDLPGAEQALREALALRRELYGPDHPEVATSLHNLAFLLHALKDPAGAESALRESLAIFRRIRGPAHADTLTVVESLVNVIGGRGAFDEAEPLLLGTLEAMEDKPEIPLKRRLDLTGLMVRIYDAWDKPDQLAKWNERLRQLQALDQSVNSPSVAANSGSAVPTPTSQPASR